ncbi:hypothetical protein ABFS83_10G117800 [Erythranthe nasuta]
MKKTGLTVKNRASCGGLAFSARNWLSSRGFVAARLVKVERRSSRYTVHSIKSVAGVSQRRRSSCYRIGIFGIGTNISNRIGTGINICKIRFINFESVCNIPFSSQKASCERKPSPLRKSSANGY